MTTRPQLFRGLPVVQPGFGRDHLVLRITAAQTGTEMPATVNAPDFLKLPTPNADCSTFKCFLYLAPTPTSGEVRFLISNRY